MGDYLVAATVEQCTLRLVGTYSMLQKFMKAYFVPSGIKDHLSVLTKSASESFHFLRLLQRFHYFSVQLTYPRRLDNRDSEKKEFFWYIVRGKEGGNMTRAELIANAALLMSISFNEQLSNKQG
jgi:hypothetical protein